MSKIVVSGLIAQYPLGGMAWHYLQYVVGLARLGHEVFYLEDTGVWPYNPVERGTSKGCDYNVKYLHSLLQRYGLGDRWAYCFPWENQWFGMSDGERESVLESADVLLNVSGTLSNPARYRNGHGKLVYIDTDPVFTQLKLLRGQQDFRNIIEAHDLQFSFGELIASTALHADVDWVPTRQPVLLDEWAARTEPGDRYTTVMNWTSYKAIEFNGVRYGQKNDEFSKFFELPARLPTQKFELAVNHGKTQRTPTDRLLHLGWQLVEPDVVCADADAYRDYIQGSKGEWSVAKSGYVAGQSGWFSERSACYLAAGRPVIVQDTGFSQILPCGEGLMPFTDLDGAIEAVQAVNADYSRHAEAARAIAAEFFDADRVLARLVTDIASR